MPFFLAMRKNFGPQKNANGGSKLRKLLLLLDHQNSNKLIVIKCLKVGVLKSITNHNIRRYKFMVRTHRD
jgi:hypothetical protein